MIRVGSFACIVTLLLAGCATTGPEAETQESGQIGTYLEDLRECDLRYSDGRPAPCTTVQPELETHDGFPEPPFVCVHAYGVNDASVDIYHDATTDRFAIVTDHPAGYASMGLVKVDDEVRHVWRPTEGVSHAIFPEGHGDLLDASFQVVRFEVDDMDPVIDGEISLDVVMDGRERWVFHLGDYHFSSLGPGGFSGASFSFFGLTMYNLMFNGADYEVRFSGESSGDFRFGRPLDPTCNVQ